MQIICKLFPIGYVPNTCQLMDFNEVNYDVYLVEILRQFSMNSII